VNHQLYALFSNCILNKIILVLEYFLPEASSILKIGLNRFQSEIDLDGFQSAIRLLLSVCVDELLVEVVVDG
jgi:hypothetical protein